MFWNFPKMKIPYWRRTIIRKKRFLTHCYAPVSEQVAHMSYYQNACPCRCCQLCDAVYICDVASNCGTAGRSCRGIPRPVPLPDRSPGNTSRGPHAVTVHAHLGECKNFYYYYYYIIIIMYSNNDTNFGITHCRLSYKKVYNYT
jgi:hypothetical protein